MKFSLDDFLKAVQSLKPDSYAASTHNGDGVDCRGFEEALVVLDAGTNGTGGTVEAKVQESNDNSSFADVGGAVFTSVTEANDETIYVGRLDLTQRQRYIRVVATVGTAACDLGAAVILGAAQTLPVSQVNAAAFSL